MNKGELIEQMAKDSNISKDKAAKALKSLTEGIQKALADRGGKITLTGFGTFAKVHLKAREGRNPSTGEKMSIQAHNVVKFRPGKFLREAVSNSPA
jgi:DNA-binding protein HU-beta